MALSYYPQPGEILLCDFSTGFVAPEMVKRRPVVIVSPRLRRRANLVTVVPLSTTPPEPVEAHHCIVTSARPLPAPFDAEEMWAKCDMIATIALTRLDRFRYRKGNGPRQYVSGQLNVEHLWAVRAGMLAALGLSTLTNQL